MPEARAMKALDAEKHNELRQKVGDMERKSEHFLRRIENALQEPYDYGNARHDYESALKAVSDVETYCEKRGVSGVRSDVKARTVEDLLAAAKKDKDELDKLYDRMASAAAAAANRRAK